MTARIVALSVAEHVIMVSLRKASAIGAIPPRRFRPPGINPVPFYRVLRKLCRRRLVLAENFGPEILSAKVYRKRLYRIAPNVKARVIFEVGS